MRRLETKGRARALQILYAWEVQGAPMVHDVATGLSRLTGPEPRVLDFAEALATRVIANVATLDREAAAATENWRMSRIGIVERNIIRLAVQEMTDGNTPPRVAIDEAVKLAHWFGGAKSAPFVNGVLDHVAHSLGRL